MISMYLPKILLPRSLLLDNNFAAAKAALETQLRAVSGDIEQVLFLPRLDALDDPLLDILAAQYHIDFYEQIPLTAELKRFLIAHSFLDHKLKGTKAGLEKMAQLTFRDAHIQEWFEYDGEPFHFRVLQDVTPDDESAARDVMNRLRIAVAETKNVRSILDFYGFHIDFDDTVKSPDETLEICIKPLVIDSYDYRRAVYRYDGEHSENGSITHGMMQAPDFELIDMEATLHGDDTGTPEDICHVSGSLEGWHDTIEPTTSFGVITVEPFYFDHNPDIADDAPEMSVTLDSFHDDGAPIEESIVTVKPHFQDTLEPTTGFGVITVSPFDDDTLNISESAVYTVNLPIMNDTLEPDEDGCIVLHQQITHDGTFKRNGEIYHYGNQTVTETFMTETDFEAWAALRDRLRAEFHEACPKCGARNYEWELGSVRLGSDHYIVSDIQLPTVRIRCADCNIIITEFLINNNAWEVELI